MAMKPHRRKRLLAILGGIVGVSIAVGLVIYALDTNMNLFYSPSQIAAGEAPHNKAIRIGGLVKQGSVVRAEDSLNVSFVITDSAEEILVTYDRILPDLFREGQGIVALGRIETDGQFKASEVLAKHDENYMAPEVKDALEKAGHPVDKASGGY